jgi:hypothetical protein
LIPALERDAVAIESDAPPRAFGILLDDLPGKVQDSIQKRGRSDPRLSLFAKSMFVPRLSNRSTPGIEETRGEDKA